MKLVKTKLEGLLIVKTDIYKDNRGFFKEIEKFKILKKKFIFDCLSFSKKNTLRGLHLQKNKSQAKIITVTQGKILDVVVDLRKKSKTYGKHFSIKISDNSDFSHGFLCLSKTCTIYYKCTNYRDQKSEITIKWDDKNLKIKWPVRNPILSKKDRLGINLSDY